MSVSQIGVTLMKNKTKGNYCYISCPSVFWKLLRGIISKDSHDRILTNTPLPDYQKGGLPTSEGTKDPLAISEVALRNCERIG